MTAPLSQTELERLLSIDEVADYIGIPKSSLYRWRVSGGGPRAMKVGKHLRFRRSDLEAWLNAQYEDETPGAAAEVVTG